MSDSAFNDPAPPSSIATSSSRESSKGRCSPENGSSDEDDCMPALPPAMLASRNAKQQSNTDAGSAPSRELDQSSIKKCLEGRTAQSQSEHNSAQRSSIIGPVIPASMLHAPNDNSKSRDQDGSSDDDSYGPALPPGFVQQKSLAVLGPAVKGPSLPPGGLPAPDDNDEEDGDVIGPLPPKLDVDLGEYAAADVERRAENMKQRLDQASRPQQQEREEWMLSLPPERAAEFGLGARQFRRSAPAERGDTSVWTEVGGAAAAAHGAPTKHKRKQEVEVDLAVQRRDKMMNEAAEKLKKNRKSSLLEMHQQKSKKAKKEQPESGPRKRQEFDRDRDLATNRFDEAQRKAAIKRSRGAADMFGAGAQKYL